MNTAIKPLSWALLLSVTTGIATGQESPPASAPTPAPGVATPGVATPGVATPGESAKTVPKSTAQLDAGEPRADTARNPPHAAAGNSTPGQKVPGAADRLDLGTATVTGDREQPKVMYIVPWKKSDIGDASGKPMNSLLDEALAPVDREVFKREVAYYDAVKSGAPQSGAAKQAEK